MYGNNGIILTICIQILNVISAKNFFRVELFPLKSVVPVGSALELNCRVKDCPGDATITWRALEDKSHGGVIEDNQTVSVSRLIFNNILPEHSKGILCKAQCSGEPGEKPAVVQVYSFPTDPVVARIKHFKANQVQRLNCTIHNIYPAEKFKIEWIRGNETLHKEVPGDSVLGDYNDVQNFSSTFNYTPSVTDLGKNISCRVTLNLPDFPFDSYRSSRTTTLEYGPGTINVSSNSSIVQLGEHLEISCHADGNPQPKILWRKIGESNPIAEGQNEKLVINNASSSQEGLYECEAGNDVGSLQMPVNVIVNVSKIQLKNGVDSSEAKNDFGMNISITNYTVKVSLKSPKNQLENGVDPSEAKYDGMNISMINNTVKVPTKIPKSQLENGVYPSEANNDFGMNISMINVTVKELQDISTTPDLPTVIVPAVGSVSFLTAIAVLIRYLRKIKRNSFNIPMN
nr:vascular cell adhesion protein 1-like [Misgurnus anguillicaudatus]